jgi:hypothetical protein
MLLVISSLIQLNILVFWKKKWNDNNKKIVTRIKDIIIENDRNNIKLESEVLKELSYQKF